MANVVWIMCTILVFSFSLDLSHTTEIIEEPQDTVVNVGETAVLPCVIQSTISARSLYVYWFKSEYSTGAGSAITFRRQAQSQSNQEKYVVSGTEYHFNLEIANTELSDSAYYYCSVHVSRVGYIDSRRARLGIYDQYIVPTCGFEPSDRSLDVGDRVTLACQPNTATTSRSSLALWKGDGVRLPVLSQSEDGSLSHMFVLQQGDRNKPYTCTPSSTYPDVNNCTVVPLLYHTIRLSPQRATTDLGGRVMFTCETNGSPPFNQFKWVIGYGRKNVVRLTESSGRYIVSTNGVSGRLTITNVVNSDNGTAVRCQAFNSLGEKLNAQAKVFTTAGVNEPVNRVPSTTASSNRDNEVDIPQVTSSSTPTGKNNVRDRITSEQVFGGRNIDDDQGSSVIATGKTSKQKPNKNIAGTIIGILLALLVLLILVVIIVLYVRRAQGKPAPKMLKRLSVNRPLLSKRFSVSKPQFMQRISLSKGVEGAQNSIEVVHRKISTLKSSSADADKRSSLRDTDIEVVVNPPPPEWQFRKVEDIEKIKRDRLISKHAPSGDYSHKEIDLLHSLVTGSVKMKTLDMVESRDAFGDDNEDDDADSQFESDFEEDEFDDPLSDSGNQTIDPSPKAPPRRKRRRNIHKIALPETNVTMETESLPQTGCQSKNEKTDNHVEDSCASEPVYGNLGPNALESQEQPTYAVVDRKSKNQSS